MAWSTFFYLQWLYVHFMVGRPALSPLAVFNFYIWNCSGIILYTQYTITILLSIAMQSLDRIICTDPMPISKESSSICDNYDRKNNSHMWPSSACYHVSKVGFEIEVYYSAITHVEFQLLLQALFFIFGISICFVKVFSCVQSLEECPCNLFLQLCTAGKHLNCGALEN